MHQIRIQTAQTSYENFTVYIFDVPEGYEIEIRDPQRNVHFRPEGEHIPANLEQAKEDAKQFLLNYVHTHLGLPFPPKSNEDVALSW